MADITVRKCDECGSIKGEANHWIEAWTDKHVPCLYLGQYPAINTDIRVDLCGQKCLHAQVDKVLNAKTVTEGE